MTQAPTPRGPLGQLIEDAKKASGKDWRRVESESGIPLSSIQAWVSGRSGEPSLRGLLHLARYLGIPAKDLAEKALEGYEPPLKASGAHSDAGEPKLPVDSVERFAARGGARGSKGRPVESARRRRGE